MTPLLRWEPDGAVNADYLAVQHLVLHDMQGEVGELCRVAEAIPPTSAATWPA
jgi:hypothetical protein